MSQLACMPSSVRRFFSVEELDELPRELGWPLEYRQIEPGAFSSTFHDVEGDTWFLMEEQSSRTVEVLAGAPADMYVMAIFEGDTRSVVNGQAIDSDCVFVQSPGSDFRATMRAGLRATQIGIAAEHFDAVIDSAAPELRIPDKDIAVFGAEPGSLNCMRRAMREALLTPSAREAQRSEATSNVISGLALIASMHGTAPNTRGLHRARSLRALNRAREYIEAHTGHGILIEEMCRHAGTTLRTLERIFLRETGLTPQQYVKVRRLNAVRRCLRSADPERDIRVTDIALDQGFTHLSRFAGDYRRHFGECPRDTLHGR